MSQEQASGNNQQDIRSLFDKFRQLRSLLGQAVPKGLIAIYEGYIVDIPTNWVLCDGNNGSPDLRGKFVYGATDDDDVGDTGGEATHTLIEAEIPSHAHFLKQGSGAVGTGNYTPPQPLTDYGNNSLSEYTGGGGAHNTLPPYVKKAYIMWLGINNLLKAK